VTVRVFIVRSGCKEQHYFSTVRFPGYQVGRFEEENEEEGEGGKDPAKYPVIVKICPP
jgi:hypothetical protein